MALQPGRLPPRALKQRMNMFLCISIVFQNTYFGRKILEIFWVTNKGGEIKTGLGKQKIREKTSIQINETKKSFELEKMHVESSPLIQSLG